MDKETKQINKTSKNEKQITQKIQKITSKIQQDPFSQKHCKDYVQRSEQYSIQGDIESAITDLSKSLIIDPTCQGYIKRGKLYASSEMFYYAFMDFQEADKLYKQEKDYKKQKQIQEQHKGIKQIYSQIQNRQTVKINKNIDKQSQNFLQHSTIIAKLPELKKIAKKHQISKSYMTPQFNTQFNKMMQKLIQQKVNEELKNIKQQNKNYENLLKLVKQQQSKIKQLQKGLQKRAIDYELIFYKQLQESIMSEQNKEKCSIYYTTLLSEMERYYLSAKVLSEFDQKVSFQDYADDKNLYQKLQAKGSISYSRKIIEGLFKLFQKYESKLQRVGQIIKQIPHLGTVIKIIKSSCKILGWFQQIKLQSECENILAVRPTVTSFNRLCGKVGYQMYKYFKVNITSQSKSQIYKKNYWEKIVKIYKKIRRNQMGHRVYEYVKPQQKVYTQQMAKVHASILMTGIAYGVFKLPNQNDLQGENWQQQIFEKISKIENQLLTTQIEEQQEVIVQKQSPKSTRCIIF